MIFVSFLLILDRFQSRKIGYSCSSLRSYCAGKKPDVLKVFRRSNILTASPVQITHEYKLIKGFAAKAPAKVLETVQTWGNDYHAVIEEDQMVSIVGNGGS